MEALVYVLSDDNQTVLCEAMICNNDYLPVA